MSRPANEGGPGEASLNVLVLGMHRSGTSALGGALLASGMAGGPADELHVAGPPNPAGYAERKDVVAINDRLLYRLQWSWDAPAPVPPTVPAPFPDLVDEGRRLVAGLTTGSPWCIKDPRISVLLPWWRRILLDRFVAVVAVRSPAEVAWSLAVRNDFPFELGVALWAAYYRHISAGLAGLPVVVVDYEALVEQPATTFSTVLDQLGRLGVVGEFDASAGAAFIRPELRRATQPPAATNGLVDVAELHRAWSTGPVAVHERFDYEPPEPTNWEVALLETHRRGGLAVAQRAPLRVRLEKLEHQLAVAQEQVRTLEAEREASRPDPRRSGIRARWTTFAQRHPRLARAVSVPAHAARALSPSRLRERRPNPLFDASWYVATYPDVKSAGIDPWRHYLRFGAAEGRDPSPSFDTDWYLAQNPDVRASGVEPLEHYVRVGRLEGRAPRATEPAREPGSGRLPTFLIIGANKGGTTSLYRYLAEHPQVFMPEHKEPHYFLYLGDVPPEGDERVRLLDPVTRELRTVDDYRALFATATRRHLALGEASTGYLTGEEVPDRVRACVPDVRLVAVLRDPADRAWSEWLMMRRTGQETRDDLVDVIRNDPSSRYVQLGLYGQALQRWLARFPRDQMSIHLFEDLTRDPDELLARILRFIAVDPSVKVDTSQVHNPREPTDEPMPAHVRTFLASLYGSDIDLTEEILGRDLSAWRKA